MMYKKDGLSFWVWASQFYLTEPLPYDVINMDNPDYDEQVLDDFIEEHTQECFEYYSVDEVWDMIEELAWKSYKTFDFKAGVTHD